jgi:Family of unknown function (DUF5670)
MTEAPATFRAGADACMSAAGREVRVVWALIAILIVLWLLGLVLGIAGALVNILLVIAAAVLVVELARRVRAPA